MIAMMQFDMTFGFDKKKNAGLFPCDPGHHVDCIFEMHHLTKHIGKLSTLQHFINLITIQLTLTATSFLKETCFCFTSIGPTIPKISKYNVQLGKKRIWNFTQKFAKKCFRQNSSKILSGGKHDKWDIPIKFCSNWMSGSYFIVVTR